MALSENRNYPLPNPSAVSARADVQQTLAAIVAIDVEVEQLFEDLAAASSQPDIDAAVASLKAELQGVAPLSLDQFNELAAAINNDPDFYASIMTVIAGKADAEHPHTAAQVGAISKTVSASDTILGRVSSGAGDVEEILCKESGRALLAAENVAAQQAILGIGSGDAPGSGLVWYASTPPEGYLECDGSALSRTTYADLYAVIGTIWGLGDGSTTFNIPDFRSEFLRGWDNGRGVDSGRALGSHQLDDFKSHTHSYSTYSGSYNTYDEGNKTLRHTNSSGTTTGSSGGSETRPRNSAVMFCIKY